MLELALYIIGIAFVYLGVDFLARLRAGLLDEPVEPLPIPIHPDLSEEMVGEEKRAIA